MAVRSLSDKDIPNRKIAGQAMIILNTLEALGGTATQVRSLMRFWIMVLRLFRLEADL